MGVGVADNHKQEVLQSTDTNVTATHLSSHEIKARLPCHQDENSVVLENINESGDTTMLGPGKCSRTCLKEEEQNKTFFASDTPADMQNEVHEDKDVHSTIQAALQAMDFKKMEDISSVLLLPMISRNEDEEESPPSDPTPGTQCSSSTAEGAAEELLKQCLASDDQGPGHLATGHAREHETQVASEQARTYSSVLDETDAAPMRALSFVSEGSVSTAATTTSAASNSEGGNPRSADVKADVFEVGQKVAYWSETHKQWMRAAIKKIILDRTGRIRCYDLDVKNGAHESKIKRLPADVNAVSSEAQKSVTNEVADLIAEVENRSRNQARELSSEVLEASSSPTKCVSTGGASAFPLEPEPTAKSEDVEAPAFLIGEAVEYWSATYKQWMASTVESVRGDGSYDLDVKQGACTSKIRKLVGGKGADDLADKLADLSGPVSAIPGVQVGCPGPSRSSWRRSSSNASALQSAVDRLAAVDRGVPQGVPTVPIQTGIAQLPDPVVPAAIPAAGVSNADNGFLRSTSPISGRMRSSVSSAVPGAHYAHRALSGTAAAEQLPQRGPSPISGRRRGYSLDQPPLDVPPVVNAPAGRGGSTQSQGVAFAGLQGKNSYASPVLRSRCVMGDAPGRAPQPVQTAHAAAPAAVPARGTAGVETVVMRQTTGGENPTVLRSGGKVYALVTPTTTAAAVRARSRSTGRNSLVPERICPQDGSHAGALTPPRCAMQAQSHSSARQFAPMWGAPTSGVGGAQTPGNFSYAGGHHKLELEDLAVADGAFDPSHPSLRSQLMAKLHLPGDANIEEMSGFRGGLNEGIWFLNAGAGRALVLKLVRGQRQHETVPTEAESFVKLSQDFPGIASDQSISFPLKIFRCVRPDTSKVHDLIVMVRAPGKRLAEITACKFHNKELEQLKAIYERAGKLLSEFHTRYQQFQHGDFQPSNVMCDEETGRITMIDAGGMARVTRTQDTDLTHFRLSMDILARSYGPELVATCLQHFQAGYDRA